MELKQWQCIDSGSDYCPCYLAEENCCIICSRLQGRDYCDCNWMGVCIYNDYHFLNRQKNNIRRPQELNVVASKTIGKVIILSIQVTKEMVRALKQPGSYVFLRNKDDAYFYDTPMSIMDCDEENLLVKVAIEIRGAKTRKLQNHGGTLSVKGPYWNGIFGLDLLKKTQNSKCLVLARSIGQAPAILPIKHMLKNNNTVDIIVNKRPDEYNFIEEYLKVQAKMEVDMVSDQAAILCRDLMEENNYDLVFIGGSNVLQNKVIKSIKEINKDTRFVTTNNNAICCGEGICGSCSVRDDSGVWIKTCKVQVGN